MTTSRESTWQTARQTVHDVDNNAVRSALGLLDEIRKDGAGMDGWQILTTFREILIFELHHRGWDFDEIARNFDVEGG